MRIPFIKEKLIPSEYTELEYLESTGEQYIDTGLNPFEIILKFLWIVKLTHFQQRVMFV